MKFTRKIPKFWLGAAYGLLLGTLIVLAIRFITYDAGYVHYHANFAVYINNQREEFKGSTYYEEVTACKVHTEMMPEDRAHMHMEEHDEDDNAVVHVHDAAVTWGQFFENLGWVVGKDFIRTRDVLYQNNVNNSLYINLNGQDLTGISSITNKVIGNEDRLLLSYGNADNDELDKQYKAVPDTARKHNQEDDPATCSGQDKTTISDRLKNLL